jgi:ATP-binding cassette subfamily C (CFTR/MRP) protein 1
LWLFVCMVLAALSAQGCWRLNDWWLGKWTSNAFDLTLGQYMGTYGAIGGAQVLLTCGMAVFVAIISTTAAKNLHERAFRSLLRAPLFFFDTTPIGRILSRFSRDQDIIDTTLGESFRQTFMLGARLPLMYDVVKIYLVSECASLMQAPCASGL